MYCSNCGTELEKGKNICSSCNNTNDNEKKVILLLVNQKKFLKGRDCF